MRNFHQMVVDYIGEVIRRITILLDQYHIVKFFIWCCNCTINDIVKGSLTLCRIILADDIRHSCCQFFLYFFFGKMQTMLIVLRCCLAARFFMQSFQTLFGTETIVRFAFFHQLFCIFKIHSGFHSLTLNIRTISTIFIRSLIMLQPGFFHGFIYQIQSSFHETLLVGILDTKQEIAALMLCDQIRI